MSDSRTPALTTTPVGLMTRLLREAFVGPPGPWTYFTDTTPGTGVLGTIGEFTAIEASVPGGPGHTTVAGHVHHLSFSLELWRKELRGESSSRDRTQSWTVSQVDEAGWKAEQERVRHEYEKLLATVMAHGDWDEETVGMVMGAVAHTAYHLGAIRQRLHRS